MAACDVFLLKHILHDWDDAASITILRKIARVAKAGARLAIVEHVLGASPCSGMERAKAMMDINMMAANPPGAGERTWEEYAALFARAGFAKPSQLVKMRDLVSTVVTEV